MGEPKIAVLGAGASGAAVASDLIRAGRDVTVIDQWPAHVEAMRSRGLEVGLPDGRTSVVPVSAYHVCQVAEAAEPLDMVFLAVKAFDTRWSVELIAPRLAEDGVVVGLQNGMTADTIASIVGYERTLGAVVEIASALFEPGIIARATGPEGTWYGLGSPDERGARHVAPVADVLGAAGTVEPFVDINSAKWMKLVGNAAEFLPSAILDLPLVEALHIPAIRAVADAAGREALAVGLARGHEIVPLFGDEQLASHDADTYASAVLDAILEGWSPPGFRVALLQDWMKGRRGEGEDINGLVVSESARLGLSAPANAALLDFSRQIERGRIRRGIDNSEALIAAAGRAQAPAEH